MRVLRFARRLLVAAAVIGCSAVLVPAAEATFPGANGKIVFSRDGDLWTVNPDGSELTQLTSGARVDWQPKWSPDGALISFSAISGTAGDSWSHGYDGYQVFVHHPDGSEARFGAPRVDYYDHAWSPDGQLLFSTEQNAIDYGGPPGQSSRLVVANLDGSAARVVLESLFPAADPDWSPLGDRIVLLLHYDGAVIYFVNPDGTDLTGGPAVANPGDVPSNTSPSWSPDGTRLAFDGSRASDGFCPGECVFTVKPDGTDLQRVTADPTSFDSDPVWSPDGSQIAFVHTATYGDPPEIWVMNADGSDRHFLTEGAQPDWQPLIAPRHLHPPRVGVDPREGRAVAGLRGRWLGTPTVSFTYQWSLCDAAGQNCADIPEATESAYTPTHDDVQHRLRVTVTGTNDYGQAAETSDRSALVGESLVGSSAGELLLGTEGSDLVSGGGGADTIRLRAGNDIGRGGYGNDWIAGGLGKDAIRGGPGRDRLRGGGGSDRIYSRDRYRDVISCGTGRDFVRADRRDRVAASCEIVRYG